MDNETEKGDAVETLQSVYLPAFLEKCAERGVEISSEEDLQGLLEIAAAYRMHQDGSRHSVIKEASLSLKKAVGLDQVEEAEQAKEQVKAATDRFAQDSKVRELVKNLVLQDMQAAQPKE